MYDTPHPLARMTETQSERRGHAFLPPDEELIDIPGLFDQEETPDWLVMIHLHYFGFGIDWWVAELGQRKDAPGRWDAFGYRRIENDSAPVLTRFSLNDIEWLSVPIGPHPSDPILHLHHLAGVRSVVERDLHWSPAAAFECIPGMADKQNGATRA
ncbi:hypothetical protein [Streptomonospora salina]|uniref:Uncharacterized protein n=1 Tax=Streptomonospora salina TaxID=104205 RepID=A0A841EAT0_9ACTN|nr:hypothetical protein [Streptomonospora salina]MBB6000235.1 hypothetical protein [Streptomonospora salina]